MTEQQSNSFSLNDLTVLIITFNEQDNIERTLNSVSWAKNVLLLDSFSDDKTLEIARRFANVTIIQREFDGFAGQCNYGLQQIETEWVLSIDADYVLPENCEASISALIEGEESGFEAEFDYLVHGKRVLGSILPPRTVLYRTHLAEYRQDGHGHRVQVSGKTGRLPFRIAHDDRKSLSRWCRSQVTYAKQEAIKLNSTPMQLLSTPDKVRQWIIAAPVLVFVLVYFVRGGFLSGWRGLHYAIQRLFAELLLSMFLLELKISGFKDSL